MTYVLHIPAQDILEVCLNPSTSRLKLILQRYKEAKRYEYTAHIYKGTAQPYALVRK